MTEDENEDPLPALWAEIDQAAASAPMVAQYARSIFNAFKAEGFDDAAALYLTAVQLQSNPGTAP